VGGRAGLRRRLLTLGSPEGTSVIVAVVPVLMTVAALVASMSRGGILSFAAALALASTALRRRRQGLPAGVLALLLVLPLAWFGLDRLGERFRRVPRGEVGRTAVWRHAVASMSGTWITGAGLNTFRAAVSRVLPLAMPEGAPPWPGEVAMALPAQLHIGYRTPVGLPGWQWYEEAHNDYVQLAVEMGAVGAVLAIWALARLAGRLREPWLAAAVVGILVHSAVDFSLQIPAVAVLFVVVCAFAQSAPAVS
jgi:O-antigen ligase